MTSTACSIKGESVWHVTSFNKSDLSGTQSSVRRDPIVAAFALSLAGAGGGGGKDSLACESQLWDLSSGAVARL